MEGIQKDQASNLGEKAQKDYPKDQASNPDKKAPKNYPHIMLKGDREDVASLISFIDYLYHNDDFHTLNLPIARELPAGMVVELQNEIGKKHNVNIQQYGY